MEIINQADVEASWFCYNSNDDRKLIALASGDLAARNGRFTYHPPQNSTGRYHVLFTVKGMPPNLDKLAGAWASTQYKNKTLSEAVAALQHMIPGIYAAGEVAAVGTITMTGSGRPYQVQARDGYAGQTEGYQAG